MNQCNSGETVLFGLVTCYPNSPITVAERLVGNLTYYKFNTQILNPLKK